MLRTLLACIGLAFIGYWVWTSESGPAGQQASLDPVLPSLVRLNSLPTADNKSVAEVSRWLKSEAAQASRVKSNPMASVMRLKKKALSLKALELQTLKAIAVSQSASGDERFLAIYIIGLAESAQSRQQLKEISESPVPPTSSERAHSDEIMIRANAREMLNRLN